MATRKNAWDHECCIEVVDRDSVSTALDMIFCAADLCLEDEWDLLEDYVLEYPRGKHVHCLPDKTVLDFYWYTRNKKGEKTFIIRHDSHLQKEDCYLVDLIFQASNNTLRWPLVLRLVDSKSRRRDHLVKSFYASKKPL